MPSLVVNTNVDLGSEDDKKKIMYQLTEVPPRAAHVKLRFPDLYPGTPGDFRKISVFTMLFSRILPPYPFTLNPEPSTLRIQVSCCSDGAGPCQNRSICPPSETRVLFLQSVYAGGGKRPRQA